MDRFFFLFIFIAQLNVDFVVLMALSLFGSKHLIHHSFVRESVFKWLQKNIARKIHINSKITCLRLGYTYIIS